MNDELTRSVEESGASVVLLVRGVLTRKSGMALDAVLRKLLLNRGRLLVDVSALCAVARCAAILGGPAKRLRAHPLVFRSFEGCCPVRRS